MRRRAPPGQLLPGFSSCPDDAKELHHIADAIFGAGRQALNPIEVFSRLGGYPRSIALEGRVGGEQHGTHRRLEIVRDRVDEILELRVLLFEEEPDVAEPVAEELGHIVGAKPGERREHRSRKAPQDEAHIDQHDQHRREKDDVEREIDPLVIEPPAKGSAPTQLLGGRQRQSRMQQSEPAQNRGLAEQYAWNRSEPWDHVGERSKQGDAHGETERRKCGGYAEIDPRGDAIRVALLGLADELTQRSRDVEHPRRASHTMMGNEISRIRYSSGMTANPSNS